MGADTAVSKAAVAEILKSLLMGLILGSRIVAGAVGFTENGAMEEVFGEGFLENKEEGQAKVPFMLA